ncbi:CPBP family intramembrane glutamic endopeptidase [Lactobacillus taiwanensis]|uniref:CPBP family intramembrane glutamic endopeptidase n=1 Tax=Lactobacillus taiwanensis TaxID=508451 RepID=UPI00272BD366|nr:CPBP family intramembrane glutamic endopeptidase [Lactobacillus taiwanensis]
MRLNLVKQSVFSKLLTLQVLLNIIFTIFISKDVNIIFFIFQEIILIIILLLKNRNTFLSILFLPFIFMFTYSVLLYAIVKKNPEFSVPIYFFYFIGMLLILVPVVIEKYGKIKQPSMQLMALIWLVWISIYAVGIFPLINKKQNEILFTINESGILYAFIAVICIYLLFKLWGYTFNINFNMKNFGLRYYIVFFSVLLFITWYTLFHTFLGLAQSNNEIFYNWNFSLINPIYSKKYQSIIALLLNSWEPAIYEEVQRYAYILILLVIFKNKKFQLQYCVLVSAVLFSLSHISNFFSTELPFNNVMSQIIVSFGLGVFLAILFLYTGKLWLNILIHFVLDFLNFSITDIGYLTVSIFGNNEWLLKSSIELFILLFSAFILMIINIKTLKNNIEKLIQFKCNTN